MVRVEPEPTPGGPHLARRVPPVRAPVLGANLGADLGAGTFVFPHADFVWWFPSSFALY